MENKRTLILTAITMALALVVLLLWGQSLAASPPPDEIAAANPQAPADDDTGVGWSSGWTAVPTDTCQVLNHNLNRDPGKLAVEMWFKDTYDDDFPFDLDIHGQYYGGFEHAGYWRGAWWQNLTANTIEVCRTQDDLLLVNQLRVRVWDAPGEPDYDSNWTDIDPRIENTLTFSHNLGVDATELTVGIMFSGTLKGIHHYAYGGLWDGVDAKLHGASWQRLTDNTVQVFREPDDEYVEQVRVVVLHPEPPDYDSLVALGHWQVRDRDDPVNLVHNLNWNPNMQVVRAECRSEGYGIHQRSVGWTKFPYAVGWEGASLTNITRNGVSIEWAIFDVGCPEARVRVWKRGDRVLIPFIQR